MARMKNGGLPAASAAEILKGTRDDAMRSTEEAASDGKQFRKLAELTLLQRWDERKERNAYLAEEGVGFSDKAASFGSAMVTELFSSDKSLLQSVQNARKKTHNAIYGVSNFARGMQTHPVRTVLGTLGKAGLWTVGKAVDIPMAIAEKAIKAHDRSAESLIERAGKGEFRMNLTNEEQMRERAVETAGKAEQKPKNEPEPVTKAERKPKAEQKPKKAPATKAEQKPKDEQKTVDEPADTKAEVKPSAAEAVMGAVGSGVDAVGTAAGFDMSAMKSGAASYAEEATAHAAEPTADAAEFNPIPVGADGPSLNSIGMDFA